MRKRFTAMAVCMSMLILTLGSSACALQDSTTHQAREIETTTSEKEPIEMEHLHGSAEKMIGTTLVYSIFASDKLYSWDEKSEDDQDLILEINSYLKIAGEFLSESASQYDQSADFITDFKEHKDLCSFATFDGELEDLTANDELSVWEYIEDNVNVEELEEKYQADNVIFFAFMNTDIASQAVSCARNWYEGMEYPYEVVFLFNVDSGYQNPPAVYAHEMLHTFGAPDYYTTDSEYILTYDQQEFVEMNLPNDIMLTCTDLETGDYVYDRITNEVSELTAYYIGLTEESSAQMEVGLGRSQHMN